jgi:quaternary ammonium compound-resistance protein SugE
MAWVLLLFAGLLEIVWAFTMKLSQGFTRHVCSHPVGDARQFRPAGGRDENTPLGTAYAVWTGIGAVGAFLVGIVVLGESVNTARVLAAVLIVSGLILMKVSSP